MRSLLRFSSIQSRSLRRFSSTEDAAKAARKLRAATGPTNQNSSGKQKSSTSNNNNYLYGFLGTVLLGAGYATYDIMENKDGFLGRLYYGSPLDKFIQNIYNKTYGQILLPQNDKLIPDFVSGPHYGEIPPGAQAPILVVLDLERTLIGSVYDAKHGWRHVKRPGNTYANSYTKYYTHISNIFLSNTNPSYHSICLSYITPFSYTILHYIHHFIHRLR